MAEHHSICRYCPGACGVIVDVSDEGRIAGIRADRSHRMSEGYACIKGLQAPVAANGDFRILRPLARQADGSFREIGLEQALDEIAAKMAAIIAESGPRSIGLFKGTNSYFNTVLAQMMPDFMAALGSPNYFSTMTIDQSAKWVTMGRMGFWDAGRHRMDDSDVMMLVGTNPLLSISTAGYVMFNATKQMKRAKARGMKLIVIDPRRSETAEFADLFLQPYPGEDAGIFAAIIRIILDNDWHDADFCDRHVAGIDSLHAAVRPFSDALVSERSGVAIEDLHRAAAMFARDATRGIATTGTGATMSPHSNLVDHLVECLNVICGRMLREGEAITNPGVLTPPRDFRAAVIPPSRSWENDVIGRTGFGRIFGEMMSSTLPDEILLPGKGRIRALFVAGGNPAVALPDQRRTVEALRSLDLLVATEPYMTPTARLCDYILPPRLQYERTDVLFGPILEQGLAPLPFQQYVPAVATPPQGAEVTDDWYVYWGLAKRLGLSLDFAGEPLDVSERPTTDHLLDILLRGSTVPLDEIRKHPGGKMFDVGERRVIAGPEDGARFDIAPPDVVAELVDALATSPASAGTTHRLAVRRMREVMNTTGSNFPEIRRRLPYNPAFLHPDDLAALGLSPGDYAELRSETGRIEAIVQPDDRLKPGVVSISHCWGGLPDDGVPFEEKGASTNLLVSASKKIEAINAMPHMSAIPIRVTPSRRAEQRRSA